MVGWRLRRVQEAADEAELVAERTMGMAVQLHQGVGVRAIGLQPGKHGFDAGLDEWVGGFRADAELNASAAPQLEASPVIGIQLERGGG